MNSVLEKTLIPNLLIEKVRTPDSGLSYAYAYSYSHTELSLVLGGNAVYSETL
jgi:hypothetical protein